MKSFLIYFSLLFAFFSLLIEIFVLCFSSRRIFGKYALKMVLWMMFWKQILCLKTIVSSSKNLLVNKCYRVILRGKMKLTCCCWSKPGKCLLKKNDFENWILTVDKYARQLLCLFWKWISLHDYAVRKPCSERLVAMYLAVVFSGMIVLWRENNAVSN